MSKEFATVAEAFSKKALVYDRFGENHPNLTRMREIVYKHVLSLIEPGSKMLEINAGTGTDASAFALQGFRIHATDISREMVNKIDEKIRVHGLDSNLSSQQISFTELHRVNHQPFQYILSNLGGLNCISSLDEVVEGISSILTPGGIVTVVIMPPICPWEWFALLRGDTKTATRRLHADGVLANIEGVQFMTYYHTPGQVRESFGSDYVPLKRSALSLFSPPADNKKFPRKHPNLYRILVKLDQLLGHHPPFNNWGDFFIASYKFQPK